MTPSERVGLLLAASTRVSEKGKRAALIEWLRKAVVPEDLANVAADMLASSSDLATIRAAIISGLQNQGLEMMSRDGENDIAVGMVAVDDLALHISDALGGGK